MRSLIIPLGLGFRVRVRVKPSTVTMSLGHIIHAKKCFTIMLFRHLSTYLMNAIKTGSALPPSSKIH